MKSGFCVFWGGKKECDLFECQSFWIVAKQAFGWRGRCVSAGLMMTSNSMQITKEVTVCLSHCSFEWLRQFRSVSNITVEDSGPGSESCGNGMQGEWGTSREKPRVDWSPCTRSDPAERIDSSYSTAALCTRIYSCNALARSQMMSPFSTSHLCISALDLFIIETYKNLIKFWIKMHPVVFFVFFNVCEGTQTLDVWQQCLLSGGGRKNKRPR